MRALELRIPPLIAFAVVAVAMWWTANLQPVVSLPRPLRISIAGGCALFGLIVAVLGILTFRKAKTTISPVHPEAASSLVSGGVYSYTRNPMYLGLTAVVAGWAVWLSVAYAFLGPVALMLFLTRFQIIPEERVMSAKFGRAWDDYSGRVRRWL
ncbi:MAG: isoprenylcysteine carboxylmethyltransferase family protein [Acidobacteria bacterium]|nr:isoprenylcysteine carboxylmethyltransferase family protein [Acidobacteriota bacterium]